MSKYHALPTAFLWPLFAGSITTSASTNIPAMETACDVVLGHYSLLDVMTSDRACVGPVERGAWRWGVTTTIPQPAALWSTQVKMAGVASLGDSLERVVG